MCVTSHGTCTSLHTILVFLWPLQNWSLSSMSSTWMASWSWFTANQRLGYVEPGSCVSRETWRSTKKGLERTEKTTQGMNKQREPLPATSQTLDFVSYDVALETARSWSNNKRCARTRFMHFMRCVVGTSSAGFVSARLQLQDEPIFACARTTYGRFLEGS